MNFKTKITNFKKVNDLKDIDRNTLKRWWDTREVIQRQNTKIVPKN